MLCGTKSRLTPENKPEKLIILYCKDICFYGLVCWFKEWKSKSIFFWCWLSSIKMWMVIAREGNNHNSFFIIAWSSLYCWKRILSVSIYAAKNFFMVAFQRIKSVFFYASKCNSICFCMLTEYVWIPKHIASMNCGWYTIGWSISFMLNDEIILRTSLADIWFLVRF